MLKNILNTLTRAFIGAYGISITSFLIVRLLFDEGFLLVALFNSFVHLLVLPALLLIVVAALLRWRDGVLLLVLPFAAAVWWYVPALLPKASVEADGQPIRVLSYNVLGTNQNYDGVLQIIREADADMVLLQEVSTELAEVIAQQLDDPYPEQHMHVSPGRPIGGMGILSRLPVQAYETWQTRFVNQYVEVDVNGQPLHVFNVHALMPFPRSFEDRNRDIGVMLDYAAAFTGPVVLAGDFNMTPQAELYQRAVGMYDDAFAQAGTGPGFTYHFFGIPAARIDYVFYNDDLRALDADVIPRTQGSDHAPLVVELVIGQ